MSGAPMLSGDQEDDGDGPFPQNGDNDRIRSKLLTSPCRSSVLNLGSTPRLVVPSSTPGVHTAAVAAVAVANGQGGLPQSRAERQFLPS